jgi:hypothetical protein
MRHEAFMGAEQMNLETWIQQELDDVVARLNTQVLAFVPPDRRIERPGGGNSINWATFHVARHAELALAVLTRTGVTRSGSLGLGELEPQGPQPLDAESVERYAAGVFEATRTFGLNVDTGALETIPDTAATLVAAGVPRDELGWLYKQWVGKPAAFFIRWPLTAHATNHIGEMIATRNRLGLSPYSS